MPHLANDIRLELPEPNIQPVFQRPKRAKYRAEQVCPQQAYRLFLRYRRLEQPNAETVEAIKESEKLLQDPSAKRYADVEDAIRDLNK